MNLSIKSAVLLTMLEYVLSKGLDWAEVYTAEKEEEIKEWIAKIIPGEEFDAMVWDLIKPFIPKLFDVARQLVDQIDGKAGPELAFMKLEAVKNIVS